MAGFLFLFVSSFGGGYGRWLQGIWWRNLAYFLAGFAALGVLGFAVLFVPNLVYLVARFGVLAGVLGVLGRWLREVFGRWLREMVT